MPRTTVGRGRAPRGRRPRARRRPLRPLRPHQRLQRRDQPAPVPAAEPLFPTRVPRTPTTTYRDALDLERRRPALRAAPRARRDRRPHLGVGAAHGAPLCVGDLFIWASRTPATRRRCSATRASGRWRCATWRTLEPELLLPGARPADRRVATASRGARRHGASARVTCIEQTLALMNQGAPLDDDRARGAAAADLLAQPYLRPLYDEPEFVVRNIWRLYGGWYDGNPAQLKPAPDAAIAARSRTLAGGADRARGRTPSSSPPAATCASRATSPRWPPLRRTRRPPCARVAADGLRRRRAAESSSWPAASTDPPPKHQPRSPTPLPDGRRGGWHVQPRRRGRRLGSATPPPLPLTDRSPR